MTHAACKACLERAKLNRQSPQIVAPLIPNYGDATGPIGITYKLIPYVAAYSIGEKTIKWQQHVKKSIMWSD